MAENDWPAFSAPFDSSLQYLELQVQTLGFLHLPLDTYLSTNDFEYSVPRPCPCRELPGCPYCTRKTVDAIASVRSTSSSKSLPSLPSIVRNTVTSPWIFHPPHSPHDIPNGVRVGFQVADQKDGLLRRHPRPRPRNARLRRNSSWQQR